MLPFHVILKGFTIEWRYKKIYVIIKIITSTDYCYIWFNKLSIDDEHRHSHLHSYWAIFQDFKDYSLKQIKYQLNPAHNAVECWLQFKEILFLDDPNLEWRYQRTIDFSCWTQKIPLRQFVGVEEWDIQHILDIRWTTQRHT